MPILTMKNILASIILIALCTACGTKEVDPEVHTVYASKKLERLEAQRRSALLLYDAYTQSDKSQRFYEVVYKKVPCFILNYYPEQKLLSLCDDKGEGWGWQYKNVEAGDLKALSNFTFEEWRDKDRKLLELNKPFDFSQIKTNDDPMKLR